MADWLKVNHTLLRSAKIRALMRHLHCQKHTALGIAVNWLVWVDEQTTDGKTNLTDDELDAELGYIGIAQALCSIGWAKVAEDGTIEAVEYEKHCGETAKARAVNARRVAKCTARKKAEENAQTNAETNEDSLVELMPEHYKTNAPANEKTLAKPLAEKKRKEYIIKDTLKAPNNTTVVISGDEQPEAQRLEAPAPERARSCKPLPADAEEVQRFMAAIPLCSLQGDELAHCAASFFDTMEGNGWTAGPHAAPVADWHAIARKFLRSWQNRSASDAIAARKKEAPATRYRSETKPDYSL